MSFTKYTNCHLIDNGQVYQRTDLYVNNTTKRICEKPKAPASIKTVDLHGNYLSPGFIDIQNNGIYGLNFSNLSSSSSYEEILMFEKFYKDAMTKYLSTGVTSTCPTVTSNFPEVYEKVLPFYH